MSKIYYKRRNRRSAQEDLAWLRRVRDTLSGADAAAFPVGEWPLRTAQMDRVLKARRVLQQVIVGAIEEARAEAGAPSDLRDYRWSV
jgi:hypothetical protein